MKFPLLLAFGALLSAQPAAAQSVLDGFPQSGNDQKPLKNPTNPPPAYSAPEFGVPVSPRPPPPKSIPSGDAPETANEPILR